MLIICLIILHQPVRPAATFSLITCYGFSNQHKAPNAITCKDTNCRAYPCLHRVTISHHLFSDILPFCSIIGILEKAYLPMCWCQLFHDTWQVTGWGWGTDFSATLCKVHNEKQEIRPRDSCPQHDWTINQLQCGNKIETGDWGTRSPINPLNYKEDWTRNGMPALF